VVSLEDSDGRSFAKLYPAQNHLRASFLEPGRCTVPSLDGLEAKADP
jgi:hypothetical protein